MLQKGISDVTLHDFLLLVDGQSVGCGDRLCLGFKVIQIRSPIVKTLLAQSP